MRDYGIVTPGFWTGKTGRGLKAHGPETMLLAAYLITSPHANALGVYYLPVEYITKDTGIPSEGASKGLRRAFEGGFAAYDPINEVVWVYEMARYQVGASLAERDNRRRWVAEEYAKLPKCRFLKAFFDKYAVAYGLTKARGEDDATSPFEGAPKGLRRGFEGDKGPGEPPPKGCARRATPLRSQDQDQEQDQEKDKDTFSLRENVCSEPPEAALAPASDPVVIRLPTNKTGVDFAVTERHVEQLREAYPAVDVVQELKKIRVWCDACPAKRKTARGMMAFLSRWMGKEQDKGGPRGGPAARQMSPAQARTAGLNEVAMELQRKRAGGERHAENHEG